MVTDQKSSSNYPPHKGAGASRGTNIGGVILDDETFLKITRLLHRKTGIFMTDKKKAMVANRLRKRIIALNFKDFRTYFKFMGEQGGQEELQIFIDLLSTNETYFYREPRHFEFLAELFKKNTPGHTIRIWSAACSSGQEAYTTAMVAERNLNTGTYSIIGSDISQSVLETARAAVYPMKESVKIPQDVLKEFCLRGTGSMDGYFKVIDRIKKKVEFRQINLMEKIPPVGNFDIVFLRNVMIYFNNEDRQKIMDVIFEHIVKGGHLIIGQSESIVNIKTDVELTRVGPSIYRKED